MATDRSASRYQGLLIPDSRITVANITDQGTGNTDSAFGQGGPRPGVPKPSGDTDLILQASGSQAAKGHLEIYTQRAGHAGRDGAGFLWRDVAAGDSASQYQGWDPYSVLTGWESLVADKTNTNDAHPAIIRLANGKLLATGTQVPDGIGQFQLFYIYDPASGAWTTKTRTLPGSTEQTGAALVELPGGRVLWIGRASDTAQVEVRYSDDEFSTWATASSRALKTACGGAILKAVAAYSAGEVGLWLLWEDGSSTQTMSQYASDDLGLRFSRVVNDWNAEAAAATPASPAVIAAEGGGFLLGYVHTSSGQGLVVWHVSSAFVAPVSGESVIVDATGSVHPLGDDAPMALWRDESGAVFVMGYAGTPGGEAALFASHDDGRTWDEYNAAQGFDVFNSGADPVFKKYAVASTSGRAIMLTRWTSGLSFDPGSLGVLHLGGYGRHTAPISDAGTEFTDADGIGFSPQSGGSGDGFMYVPIELPGSAGWTKTGSGAESEEADARSGSLPASAIALKTDATSAAINYEQTITATAQVFAQFACSIASGAGDQTDDDIAVKVRITGGPGTSYEVRYRFSDTGWTIVDPSGPTEKGSVTEATTTAKGLILHRVAISVPESGTVKFQTWWCRFGHTLDWVAGPNGTLGNQTTPADSAIEFGHFNGAQTDVVHWHHLSLCGWGNRWSPTSELRIGDSSDWANPGSLHPRNVPPIALPALVDGNTKIAAIDGPTVEAETWDVLTDYDNPIDHAVAAHGPRISWQSVDETAQEIVWDLHSLAGATASTFLNSSIGCALLGCNFRTANLEYWSGAAWVSLIALDAAEGFEALKYTLSGNVATVDTGQDNTAGRYLNYDDLRGATFKQTGGKARKILTQTEGAWTDSTTKRPRLLLDGINGSLSASGTCELWFPDMCGISHEVTASPRYIRLQIPASQVTVSGYYEIGQIVIGSLLIFGHQPSRGFSTATQQGTAITDLADGSTRATRTGPPRRSLELSWDDGIDASQTQASSAVPDYVAGTSGGLPVATRSDIARTLEGALREAASADVPVVYIGRIPTNSATPDTLNNPRQFLYGRASGEYRREHILGDEAASEVDRIAKITITEVV
jgi:hypothetical protein